MRVALIWPNNIEGHNTLPMGLGYLKSNADNSKHDIRIFDCYLLKLSADSPGLKQIIKEFDPHVVGVSCWTAQAFEALRILRSVKSVNEDIVTLIGGVHASAYPVKTVKHKEVDFLFQGEAELSFPIFLEELEKKTPDWSRVKGLAYETPSGEIIQNTSEQEEDLDKIKYPDYDAINWEAYTKEWHSKSSIPFCRAERLAPIWITRGCPYTCQYCTAPIANGKTIRTPSVEYVVNWVKYLYHEKKIRHINILDDNFTFDVKYAKTVCRAIIAENLKGLKFETIVGIRQERTDPELFDLMKQAGWEIIIIAPESGSLRTLEKMKKKMDPETIPAKVEQIKNAGLKAVGYFIVGYPGETEKDLVDTKKLILKSRFNFVFLFSFRPLPGTPIYDELITSGELSEDSLEENTSLSTGSSERVYTTKTLKHFNLPRFVIKTYLELALVNLHNFPFMMSFYPPKKMFILFYGVFSAGIRKACRGYMPRAIKLDLEHQTK